MRLRLLLVQGSFICLSMVLGFVANGQITCGLGNFYATGNSPNSGSPVSVYHLVQNGNAVNIPNALSPLNGPSSLGLMSLAIADLGSGQSFYSFNKSGKTNNVYRYDGSTWNVVYSDTLNYYVGNSGGNGNYLYFHSSCLHRSPFWPGLIMRFNGSSMTTIWRDSSAYVPVADVAVDDAGNAYFFTGVDYDSVTTLNIISPTGAMIDTIPVNFDASNAYGCFFDNDILWVTLGPTNATSPNSMLPITIYKHTATLGTPVPLPYPSVGTTPNGQIKLSMTDAASCGSANIVLESPTTATSHLGQLETAYVYPNPAGSSTELRWSGPGMAEWELYDMLGNRLQHAKTEAGSIPIDLSAYPNGMYIVSLNYKGEVKHLKVSKRQ